MDETRSKTIPDQYIVVFRPGTPRAAVLAAEQTVERLGGRIGFKYTTSFMGFSASLPPRALQALRGLRAVAWIEPDQIMTISVIQSNPPNGLDRTSERLLPLDQKFTHGQDGTGVHAYVIDTGIRATHGDFVGRANGNGFTSINDGHGTSDCGSVGTGHGTHVAGTIGGAKYGIAKNVSLHSVRVLNCSGSGTLGGVIAGVDWVTNNAIHPAVANMSLGGGASAALDLSVTHSVTSGVTYTVAAGNNSVDACTVSPARVPTAITVGAVNPVNDTTAIFTNIGTCLDLFAPGVGIESSWNRDDAAATSMDGTSMAAPHVAGVAALALQLNPAATPAAVWAAIHYADNVPSTPNWPGINPGVGPPAGSPNELLHWGSLNNGFNDGEPHITTVDGTRYDFQAAGEFVTLRDATGFEIQTRQSPVATSYFPWPNPHTGIASCVSVNTAVAARVGPHRVTFQPHLSGVPDPSGLQLRLDGVLMALGSNGITLGPGGRIAPSPGGGIEIAFPNGTTLVATPGWWAEQSKWYINLSVFHTPATEGIMGAIAPGSWLPTLPDGTSVGPKPASAPQRFADLNQKFADAWRVNDKTSLFDYAPGTSTATFTLRDWPKAEAPCVAPESKPARPAEARLAERACALILDENLRANCVYDVTATGDPGFAKTYALSWAIRMTATRTEVRADKASSRAGEPVTFTASVTRQATHPGLGVTPAGAVQFLLDGERVGNPVKLGTDARATWKTPALRPGEHRVAAIYIPERENAHMSSRSPDETHTVGRRPNGGKPDLDVRPDRGADPAFNVLPQPAPPPRRPDR